MISLLQVAFHRWWNSLWRGRNAAPRAAVADLTAERDVGAEVARIEEAIRAEPLPEKRITAPHPDEVEAALTGTVLNALDEPRVIMALGDAELAAKRERSLTALAGLQQIPALQSIAQGFLKATARDDVDLDEVVDGIGRDPALSVRVLRMANSAAIGPAERIEDLPTAVHMLGVVRVRTLVQALYTMRDSRSISPGFDWRHLWVHSLATATVAEELARRLGMSAGPVTYLSALLHDVGKIVLSVVVPEDYGAVLVTAWRAGQPLDALERSTLGVTHREAGEIYLEQSGLPAAVIAAAVHHHKPGDAPPEHRQTVALVTLANYLCKSFGLGFSGALLTESDGDFTELEAWKIIEEETGRIFDRAEIEEELSAKLPGIKADLASLRVAAG